MQQEICYEEEDGKMDAPRYLNEALMLKRDPPALLISRAQ
jgi:hypothetical protein